MTEAQRPTVRFDQSLKEAIDFVRANRAALGSNKPLLVRDLHGRISIALNDEDPGLDVAHVRSLLSKLHGQLGPYSPGEQELLILKSELFVPENFFASADASLLSTTDALFLDRRLVGTDWRRAAFPASDGPRRATMYSIKGGVGRSTALCLWAQYLAREKKKNVLVIDLDLESPGVTSTLLTQPPAFGVVDWFVEDAVGAADDELLARMVARSPLSQGLDHEIRVVPAGGQDGDYMAKLARAYIDIPGKDGPQNFAQRLDRMIKVLEHSEGDNGPPDVVLIDSRAGIHEIAAVAVTRLQALSFIFAINTRQTWDSYRLLFGDLVQRPEPETLRSNLQVVAALVPETGKEDYLRRLREASWTLFQSTLYSGEAPGELEIDSFDIDENDAPHYPIPIHWGREFQEFDPLIGGEAAPDDPTVRKHYGTFLEKASQLLLGEDTEAT